MSIIYQSNHQRSQIFPSWLGEQDRISIKQLSCYLLLGRELKMNKLLTFVKKSLVFLILAVTFSIVEPQPAFAHRPHDVIEQIELSPTYNQDQTLFIFARGNLFQSKDGGSTWQRIVKGLDNRGELSSLSMSQTRKETLFLSTLGDGIYKSQDEGKSWVKVNQGLDTLDISLLEMSPQSPDLVLATGKTKGLYQTKNGGVLWTKVLDTNNPITTIGFAPDNQDQIIVGDKQGILYFSTNSGDTWQASPAIPNSGAIVSIALSPKFSSDRTVFVGTETGGMFKSTDGGKSFTQINNGLSDRRIRDIVIYPNGDNQKSDRYLILISTWDEGVWQSKDGGETWKKYHNGLTKDHQADQTGFKLPHFTDLSVSHAFNQDKTMFLAGFNGLFKSTNGGEVWQEIHSLSTRSIISLKVSPNYAKDSTIAFGTYVKELYISKDGGAKWQLVMKGLEIPRFTKNFNEPNQDPRRFFDVAFSPNYASDKTIFATVLWDNFLKSNDAGNHWDIVPIANAKKRGNRGMIIVTSPNFASDKTIYLGTQYGIIHRSTNGGASFEFIGDVGNRDFNESISLLISPDFSSDKTLYALGPEGVYKTVDAGKTWQPTATGNALKDIHILQLAMSPNYKLDQMLLAGTRSGILQTTDGGKTWAKLAGNPDVETGYVEGIAISPNYQSDRTFLVSVKGKGLFQTVDGGKTFSQIGQALLDRNYQLAKMGDVPSAGIPIQFSPTYASDRTIYGFGSAKGEVFKSTDAGNTWQILPVPQQEYKIGFLTSIGLFFVVYPKLKFLLAALGGVLGYIIFGYLRLDKKLPLNKLAIQGVGAFIVFIGVFLLLR